MNTKAPTIGCKMNSDVVSFAYAEIKWNIFHIPTLVTRFYICCAYG